MRLDIFLTLLHEISACQGKSCMLSILSILFQKSKQFKKKKI